MDYDSEFGFEYGIQYSVCARQSRIKRVRVSNDKRSFRKNWNVYIVDDSVSPCIQYCLLFRKFNCNDKLVLISFLGIKNIEQF